MQLSTPQLTLTQEFHTLLTAAHFGGRFYRTLAEAGLAADERNRATLFAAFPYLVETYGPGTSFYSEDLG